MSIINPNPGSTHSHARSLDLIFQCQTRAVETSEFPQFQPNVDQHQIRVPNSPSSAVAAAASCALHPAAVVGYFSILRRCTGWKSPSCYSICLIFRCRSVMTLKASPSGRNCETAPARSHTYRRRTGWVPVAVVVAGTGHSGPKPCASWSPTWPTLQNPAPFLRSGRAA